MPLGFRLLVHYGWLRCCRKSGDQVGVWGAGLPPTTLGAVWILLQAAFVFVLAELEWAGSRQPRGLAAA